MPFKYAKLIEIPDNLRGKLPPGGIIINESPSAYYIRIYETFTGEYRVMEYSKETGEYSGDILSKE